MIYLFGIRGSTVRWVTYASGEEEARKKGFLGEVWELLDTFEPDAFTGVLYHSSKPL